MCQRSWWTEVKGFLSTRYSRDCLGTLLEGARDCPGDAGGRAGGAEARGEGFPWKDFP